MKTFFPDDSIKQEMLEMLFFIYGSIDLADMGMNGVLELVSIIERATGLSIEEVLS